MTMRDWECVCVCVDCMHLPSVSSRRLWPRKYRDCARDVVWCWFIVRILPIWLCVRCVHILGVGMCVWCVHVSVIMGSVDGWHQTGMVMHPVQGAWPSNEWQKKKTMTFIITSLTNITSRNFTLWAFLDFIFRLKTRLAEIWNRPLTILHLVSHMVLLTVRLWFFSSVLYLARQVLNKVPFQSSKQIWQHGDLC